MFVVDVGLDDLDTFLGESRCFAATGIASQGSDLVGAILEGSIDDRQALGACATNDSQDLGHVLKCDGLE